MEVAGWLLGREDVSIGAHTHTSFGGGQRISNSREKASIGMFRRCRPFCQGAKRV